MSHGAGDAGAVCVRNHKRETVRGPADAPCPGVLSASVDNPAYKQTPWECMMARLAPKTASRPQPSVSDQIARLAGHDGSPEEFLTALLQTQCRMASAAAGAIVGVEGTAPARVLRTFPASDRRVGMPLWLALSVERAPAVMTAGVTSVVRLNDAGDLPGTMADPHLVLIPLKGWTGRPLVAAYLVEAKSAEAVQRARERLEIAAGLAYLYELRVKLYARDETINSLRTAVEVLEVVGEQERFQGAAMALCNEVAARWKGERVTLGFLDGRYVKAAAISHTESFDRKMRLVQDLESAMEECLDRTPRSFTPGHRSPST